jgi:SP family general alpha glucoside:H+ symporter-like MFS transporter
MEDQKDGAIKLEVSPDGVLSDRARLAAEHTEFERSLSFWETLRLFWRSTLWVAYGQLVVFGYGIDGIIAGYLLAVPQFRYAQTTDQFHKTNCTL